MRTRAMTTSAILATLAATIIAAGLLALMQPAEASAAQGTSAKKSASAHKHSNAKKRAVAKRKRAAAKRARKVQRSITWAPHLDRQIVPRRSSSMGKQLTTWYGPGLFGNRTACGQTLTPKTWGIAHRTLPCGTLVTLTHRGRKVSVRVIDRGPFSGATVDLTSRTKSYLRFVSGTVKMTKVKRFRVLPKSGVRRVGTFAA